MHTSKVSHNFSSIRDLLFNSEKAALSLRLTDSRCQTFCCAFCKLLRSFFISSFFCWIISSLDTHSAHRKSSILWLLAVALVALVDDAENKGELLLGSALSASTKSDGEIWSVRSVQWTSSAAFGFSWGLMEVIEVDKLDKLWMPAIALAGGTENEVQSASSDGFRFGCFVSKIVGTELAFSSVLFFRLKQSSSKCWKQTLPGICLSTSKPRAEFHCFAISGFLGNLIKPCNSNVRIM